MSGNPGSCRADRRAARALACAALVLTALSALAITGCARTLPAPAQSVESLLELRLANSKDALAYTRYLESTSVAGALAKDAGSRKDAAIPKWETPAVKSSDESSAVVLVVWKPDSAHKGWAPSTNFYLKKVRGNWVVFDAADNNVPSTNGSADTSSAPAKK